MTQMVGIRNVGILRRAGTKRRIASIVDQSVLMLMAVVIGGRIQIKPRLGWIDGGQVASGSTGMTV